jgi:hypothetical protein
MQMARRFLDSGRVASRRTKTSDGGNKVNISASKKTADLACSHSRCYHSCCHPFVLSPLRAVTSLRCPPSYWHPPSSCCYLLPLLLPPPRDTVRQIVTRVAEFKPRQPKETAWELVLFLSAAPLWYQLNDSKLFSPKSQLKLNDVTSQSRKNLSVLSARRQFRCSYKLTHFLREMLIKI